MKSIGILVLVLILGIQTGNAQKQTARERKEQKAAEVKKLIGSGDYVFVANSAQPMAFRRINLTSNYELKMKGTSAEAWLPYFGRAYQADYGDTDGGIKFKEEAQGLKTSFNERKKSYEIQFEVKTVKDNYTLYLSVGLSGYADLTVNSNNRQPISFTGMVEAPKADTEAK
ncbi:MAG: DUF4251 domain-containing protein [Mangrovibacterium sp.]